MNDRWYLLMNTQSAVVGTASSKLCGGKPFDPEDTRHVLAVLGQRFGLKIMVGHPDSTRTCGNWDGQPPPRLP